MSGPTSGTSVTPALAPQSQPAIELGACTPPIYSACGFPDASTTGVPAGTTLVHKPPGVYLITRDGTLIDGWALTGVIDVEASNVTIRNSRITGASWSGIKYGASNPRVTGLTVVHDTLLTTPGHGPDKGGYDYGIEQLGHGSMEVAYDDISGFKDGIDIRTGTVADTFIHQLPLFPGAHDQDIYVWAGGTGVTIEHNTLIATTDAATAAIYVAPDSGHQNDVTMDANWLAGGAYCVYGGDTAATNIRLSGNAFSPEIHPDCGRFGLLGYWDANPGNVATGNVWALGPRAGHPATP